MNIKHKHLLLLSLAAYMNYIGWEQAISLFPRLTFSNNYTAVIRAKDTIDVDDMGWSERFPTNELTLGSTLTSREIKNGIRFVGDGATWTITPYQLGNSSSFLARLC